MSGVCDKCGEHALECVCDDEFVTTREVKKLSQGKI